MIFNRKLRKQFAADIALADSQVEPIIRRLRSKYRAVKSSLSPPERTAVELFLDGQVKWMALVFSTALLIDSQTDQDQEEN